MPRSKSVRKKGGRLGRKPRRLAADVFAEGPSGGDDPALPSVEHDDDAMDFDIGGDLEPSDDSASESLDEGEDVAVASDLADLGKYRHGPGDLTEDQAILEMANTLEAQAALEYEERDVAPQPESLDFEAIIGGGDEAMLDVGAEAANVVPYQNIDPDDISTLLKHNQNRFIDMSKFEKALAMYVDLTGMSRSDYDALRQILSLLKCHSGAPIPEVAQLPSQLSTLKKRIRVRLPLMDMRKAPIPLKVEKLPTNPAQSKGKSRAQEQPRNKEYETVESELHFFDPTSVFVSMLSSDIRHDMHMGPAQFVDEPTELFHSRSWSSSIRTSSGIYPHILSDGQKGAVIFPSDFVYYTCQNQNCHCQTLDSDSSEYHLGRVYGFGHDMRSSPIAGPDQLVLQMQEAFFTDSHYTPWDLADKLPIWEYDEVVLTSKLTYIPEGNVIGHVKVYVDRVFGEIHDDPQPSAAYVKKVQKISASIRSARERWEAAGNQGDPPKMPKLPQSFPKYHEATVTAARTDEQLVAKRMICDGAIVPLCHTHPIRAELEMQVYGRGLYELHWDIAQPGAMKTLSMPLLSFIDGVGIYRNSYRSLMGFYVTPASLSGTDRSREASIFPIALGPHGSDFADVVKALHSMKYLDEGISAVINGEQVRICAFTLCITGDMPQAAENTGFKGPRAHKFCRFCFVGAKPENASDTSTAIMDIDTVAHGRYHIQTQQMQHMMKEQLTTAATRNEYGSQWGINNPDPPLVSICPALDIVLSRPPDAAHSEFKGMSNLMHFLLRDGILNKEARVEYNSVLRNWPFPPGGQRLMSPLHHLASYSLSDHARWSITVPALLRQWLREKHMLPKFVNTVHEALEDPVDFVVMTTAAIAKSNSVLMGRSLSAHDRENLDAIVRRARTMFNQLNIFTSHSVIAASRGGSVVEGGSRAASIVEGELVMDEITVGARQAVAKKDEDLSKRAKQYLSDTVRPNAHIAIHYPIINEEYGLVKNVDTLEGESFHRILRKRVYETNYSNIEKILLEKLNTAKTIRLVLRNGASDDGELTQDLQELYREAPSLFRSVLSETDRARIADDDDETEFELAVDQSTNDTHIEPSVISRMPQKEVKAIRHTANEDMMLPVRAGSLSDTFQGLLRSAYEDDYGFPAGTPVVLGNAPIQWSRKFAFVDGTAETRPKKVFRVGDYVHFHGDHIGRVDAIFVFDCAGVHRHIFVVLTAFDRTGDRDRLLDLEVLDTGVPVIVGVPAIEPSKPYVVDVAGVGTVLVDWDVYYL